MPRLNISMSCAPLDRSAILAVIDEVERFPFGALTHLDDLLGPVGPPLSRADVDAALRRKEVLLTLSRGDGDTAVVLGIRRRKHGSFLSLTVGDASLPTTWPLLADQARAWAVGLPAVTSGNVGDANVDLPRVHDALGLGRPPACFTTHLRWRHYRAPSFSGLFFAPGDLCATPAYTVTTLANGVVELTFFRGPFDWDGEQARGSLVACTEWLNAKDRFLSGMA